ncbi:glycosyltransferase [Neolewinella sp.]|uniref:glycosyltransferase n=1 Tax=Neolewinella sp. TaxID=2993543 RepID=UPI003B51F8B2
MLNVSDSCKVLCQIGRLDQQKNPSFTLKVASALQRRGYNFHLIFVGQGKLRRALEEAVIGAGLGDRISFLGNRNDVPQLMAGSDLLLLPSHYEGFPLVLVEAQAVGLPVIVSNKVSLEVDLGLNLVTFLATDCPERWAQTVEHTNFPISTSAEHRYAAIRAAGLDVKQNVAKLYALYALPE